MRHICWRDQPCGFGLFLDLSYEQKGNYLTRLFIMLVHTTEEAEKKKKKFNCGGYGSKGENVVTICANGSRRAEQMGRLKAIMVL